VWVDPNGKHTINNESFLTLENNFFKQLNWFKYIEWTTNERFNALIKVQFFLALIMLTLPPPSANHKLRMYDVDV